MPPGPYKNIPRLVFLLFFVFPGQAHTADGSVQERDAEHQRGVALAREGRHDEALTALSALHEKYPGYYPVERDIVVITAWKGDCRAVARRHERLRDNPALEPYYLVPVGECLMKLGRFDEAVTLLEAGQRRWPDDTALASAHAGAASRRAAQYLHQLRLEVSSNDSDQGKREWLWNARLSRKLSDRTQLYGRYAVSHSGFAELKSGRQNRLGVGIEHEFPGNLVVTQEFSGDIRRSGQGGSLTSVVYLPVDQWRFGASHTNFAEDIPLRAKAQRIEADRSHVFADFHTPDYRWSWYLSASRYDFSDTNRRSNWFSSLGYAYELIPRREQRVFIEIYQSDNTLDNTVYFNPSRDRSVSLLHKTDFVHETRFRRHVDHLYLGVGVYDQRGFEKHGTWTVRYEQDYEFTDRASLSAGVGYARRVYDGAHEFESSLSVAFRWLF